MKFLNRIERSPDMNMLENFGDNFDPSGETFDPTSNMLDIKGSATRGQWSRGGKGKDATFTLRLQNFTGEQQVVELFNPFGHISKVPNPAVYGLFSNVQPVSEGTFWLALMAMQSGAYTAGSGTQPGSTQQQALEKALSNKAIFDNSNGNLIYTGLVSDNVVQPNNYATKALNDLLVPTFNLDSLAAAKVSCNQIPYRQLLGELEDTVLAVRKVKMQVTNTTQFDNEFRFIRKSIFGRVDENTLEPSTYVDPINPNTRVIDITQGYLVDKKTGIFITLEPNEDTSLSFFVTAYKINGLAFNL